jgi:hypothetical protein
MRLHILLISGDFVHPMSEQIPKWPRVKELLDGIMERWERKMKRNGYPGFHDFHWDSPEHLANDESMSMKFIEPGQPAEETPLIVSLRRGLGSIPKMPMGGPFLKADEIDEIARWIDAGMPE